jgi:UDP-N-acetylglucosamine/UDP-N-acetyl-alpha-D-glucosaminouronate 4-epimerase
MKVLVTGGAGFIGSHLVDALLSEGAEVRVLDDLSTGYLHQMDPRADLVEGDVSDVGVVARAAEGREVIFHHAAHRAVLRSVEHPLQTDRVNVRGTLALLIAARDAGVRRVIFASSSSVYGGSETMPTPERAVLVPRSPYAVTKVTGEQYCRVFFELFGLETVALRYFNVYGPRQRPDSQYAAVIPIFIDALRAGRPPELHGDGRQSRDFTFVDDVVRANLRAATASRAAGKAYNIAGGGAASLLDLLSILYDVIGVRIPPEHTHPRPGDVRHTLADIRAAAEDLEYEPMISFADGLQRTVQWFAERTEKANGETIGPRDAIAVPHR